MRPTTSQTAYAIAAQIRSWWQERCRTTGNLHALGALTAGDLDHLARDCGATAEQLIELAARGPHAADEMHVLLRRLGIEETAAATSDSLLVREMAVTCSLCRAKAQCRNDIAADRYHGECPGYCGNKEALEHLRAEPTGNR
ncbi:DUF6455 family protein [Rhizobiaceae bacterium n13]|uniref:DUF6455 family protein n=1 Tax=Ferirhizobium litorale TaxID=2927786 RepID=A0AAE3QA19_9HYPH|nr:DUF6455 family protein [Fererhizobium litorale]MDI7860983.1 DUF6455 family protein [Fererhizobium litorale]MDI7921130.1 DUF6455 family protein [Fererhizobium litorale]